MRDNTADYRDIFLNDLSKKSGVILVTRKSDDKVVGFSTQTFFDINHPGKIVDGRSPARRILFRGKGHALCQCHDDRSTQEKIFQVFTTR